MRQSGIFVVTGVVLCYLLWWSGQFRICSINSLPSLGERGALEQIKQLAIHDVSGSKAPIMYYRTSCVVV